MSAGDGTEPIADNEILFRRVSDRSGWYDPSLKPPVAWEAFRPNQNDVRGLSVWRAKYVSAQQAAAIGARPGRRYYVLHMRAARLREAGLHIEFSPVEGGPGHATLTDLNAEAYENHKDEVRERANLLAECLVEQVEGPFGPFEQPA